MSRLDPVGISAWSSLNATGMAHADASFGASVPTFPLLAPTDEHSPLSLHPAWLGLPGRWGHVSLEVGALPAQLRFQRSRSTELLVHTLSPLQGRLLALCERYGAERVGIVLGSSTGGIDATEHAIRLEAETGAMPADFVFEEAHVYSALVRVAQAMFGARGPAFVVSTACSSSGKALGAAQRLILSGACDAVLTGGVDSLSELTVRGFGGLSILSPSRCKPFDGARDGISLGEGAALLVLQRDTDSPYVLTGVGEAGDAYHPTAPHPEGLGAELALRACLEHAGLEPENVDYVNAHGTGTAQNDLVEALVIDRTLGPSVPFSSTKDRTGHQLGTAGATEAIVCLSALMSGEVPTNRVPEVVDQSLRRQPLTASAPRARPLANVLSNSFAFGGSNVTVGLGKTSRPTTPTTIVQRPLFVLRAVSWGADGDEELPCTVLPVRARGRASQLTRIFSELFGRLVEPAHTSSIPLFLGSAYGEMSTTIALLDQMLVEPTVSPAKFQASVHNTAAGLLSIATGNRAPATAIAAGDDTVAMTLIDACSWLDCHGGRAALLVADEPGPARLMRGRTFPAFGVGLVLADRPDPEHPPLGILARPELAPGARSTAHGAAESPARWGTELVRFFAQRSPDPDERVAHLPVGPGWTTTATRTPL